MRHKKDLNQEINEFLETWNEAQLCAFFNDVFPLVELYNVDEKDDWLRDSVGEEDTRNVRLARTVYLISKIASTHASILFNTNIRFKDIHKRMEQHENGTSN